MDAATLLLLSASVGVGFGWQPMPDGSPRVEYLVQIEPEMLVALQAGSTIPIVSEVPEGIGPIGRVRIVVGHESLPRQNLSLPVETTRRKPNSNLAGATDISGPPVTGAHRSTFQRDPNLVKTQFSTPAPSFPGSGAPGNTPPSGNPSQSAQGQQNMSAPALPGNGKSGFEKAIERGQKQAAAAQAAVQGAVAQGAEFQTKLDGQYHRAAGQLGQATPAGIPNQPGSVTSGRPGAIPPGATGFPGATGGIPQAASSQAALSTGTSARAPAAGQPASPGNGTSLGNGASPGNLGPYGQHPTGTAGIFQGQRLDRPVAGGAAASRPVAGGTVTSGQQSPASGQVKLGIQEKVFPHEGNRQPYQSGPQAAASKTAGVSSTEPPASGLSFPQAATRPDGNRGNWSGRPPGQSATIAVSGGTMSDGRQQPMKAAPPAEMGRRANAGPGANPPGAASAAQKAADVPPAPKGSLVKASGVLPMGGTKSQTGSEKTGSPSGPDNGLAAGASTGASTVGSPTKGSPGMFSLLLAWVLLVGSVAGNIYLFWSYLDIRGKYQAMLRTHRGAPPQFSRAG